MACNNCESSFNAVDSVVVSIVRSGTNAYLYVQNQGRNAILIERILLCYTTPSSTSVLYLRAPGMPITWS
jgi:hypothetical protein